MKKEKALKEARNIIGKTGIVIEQNARFPENLTKAGIIGFFEPDAKALTFNPDVITDQQKLWVFSQVINMTNLSGSGIETVVFTNSKLRQKVEESGN